MIAPRVTLAQPLTREECLDLLQYQSFVGRLGFITDGRPMVLPVNYLAEDSFLVFCTAEGSALSSCAGGQVVFEVDAFRPLFHSGWSVLVRGEAQPVTDPDEIERWRRSPLKSWAAPGPQQWIRVSIGEISGRRIGDR